MAAFHSKGFLIAVVIILTVLHFGVCEELVVNTSQQPDAQVSEVGSAQMSADDKQSSSLHNSGTHTTIDSSTAESSKTVMSAGQLLTDDGTKEARSATPDKASENVEGTPSSIHEMHDDESSAGDKGINGKGTQLVSNDDASGPSHALREANVALDKLLSDEQQLLHKKIGSAAPTVCGGVDCAQGNCVDGFCQCYEGWTGTGCRTKAMRTVGSELEADCIPECVNGRCIQSACVCNEGWWAEDCGSECPGGSANPCMGHGHCFSTNGTCSCNDGWGGNDCSISTPALATLDTWRRELLPPDPEAKTPDHGGLSIGNTASANRSKNLDSTKAGKSFHHNISVILPQLQILNKEVNQFNYASNEAGAKVVSFNPEGNSPSAVLSRNSDKYWLSPCDSDMWLTIELSDEVGVQTVVLKNFEFYASIPKIIQLSASRTFPSDSWVPLGLMKTVNVRGPQSFAIPLVRDDSGSAAWIRYLRLKMVGQHGSDKYCTLSGISVFGTAVSEDLEEQMDQHSHITSRLYSARKEQMAPSRIEDVNNSTSNVLQNGSLGNGTMDMNANNSTVTSSRDGAVQDTGLNGVPSDAGSEQAVFETSATEMGSSAPSSSGEEDGISTQVIPTAATPSRGTGEKGLLKKLSVKVRELELNQTVVSGYVEMLASQHESQLKRVITDGKSVEKELVELKTIVFELQTNLTAQQSFWQAEYISLSRSADQLYRLNLALLLCIFGLMLWLGIRSKWASQSHGKGHVAFNSPVFSSDDYNGSNSPAISLGNQSSAGVYNFDQGGRRVSGSSSTLWQRARLFLAGAVNRSTVHQTSAGGATRAGINSPREEIKAKRAVSHGSGMSKKKSSMKKSQSSPDFCVQSGGGARNSAKHV